MDGKVRVLGGQGMYYVKHACVCRLPRGINLRLKTSESGTAQLMEDRGTRCLYVQGKCWLSLVSNQYHKCLSVRLSMERRSHGPFILTASHLVEVLFRVSGGAVLNLVQFGHNIRSILIQIEQRDKFQSEVKQIDTTAPKKAKSDLLLLAGCSMAPKFASAVLADGTWTKQQMFILKNGFWNIPPNV